MKHSVLGAGLTLVAATIAANAQRPSPEIDRAFDRGDRDSRAYISTVRCAQSVGQLRLMGAFGPPDSIGNVGQCVVVRGQFVGIFMALDTTFARPTRFSAVDLSTRRRRSDPVDTMAVIASKRAEWNAEERGSPAFEKLDRQYTPFSFRTDGDSIEAWLVPISLLRGKPGFVGGEHGYVYSPDGRTLAREIDGVADYRAITVADTGQASIESQQDMVPTFSEFLVANLLNNTGRSVRIDMRQRSATLVGRGTQAMWIQMPRKP